MRTQSLPLTTPRQFQLNLQQTNRNAATRPQFSLVKHGTSPAVSSENLKFGENPDTRVRVGRFGVHLGQAGLLVLAVLGWFGYDLVHQHQQIDGINNCKQVISSSISAASQHQTPFPPGTHFTCGDGDGKVEFTIPPQK